MFWGCTVEDSAPNGNWSTSSISSASLVVTGVTLRSVLFILLAPRLPVPPGSAGCWSGVPIKLENNVVMEFVNLLNVD